MSRDLFDDTTMSFGEHLEALRTHLIRALLGLVVGIIIALCFSNYVIYVMEGPVDRALKHYYGNKDSSAKQDVEKITLWESVTRMFSSSKPGPGTEEAQQEHSPTPIEGVVAQVRVDDIIARLHEIDEKFPLPPASAEPRWIEVHIPDAELKKAIPQGDGNDRDFRGSRAPPRSGRKRRS